MSEENDEFDDPSLLQDDLDDELPKKSKKKEKKSDSKKDKKESEKDDEENNDIYPTLEQLQKDKLEEMNKYKFFL